MHEQLQLFDQPRSRIGIVLWGMPAAVMFIMLTIASCTTSQGFNAVYTEVVGFFSLGGTVVATWLRANSEFGHFIGYLLLSLSLCVALSRRLFIVAPLIAVIFGLMMEVAQVFIPTRGASLTDMGFNVLGVVFGFGLYFLWLTLLPRNMGTPCVRLLKPGLRFKVDEYVNEKGQQNLRGRSPWPGR